MRSGLSLPTILKLKDIHRRGNSKACLRETRCLRGQLQGNLSRVLSPSIGHPSAYGKFVMEKEENTQRIFISGFPSVPIHYFPKGLILDKEELTLDMEEEILSPRLKDFLS